jgi:hypothetical protein
MCALHLFCHESKQPNLKLKTWSRQLLGYLPLALALPGMLSGISLSYSKQVTSVTLIHKVIQSASH